MTLSEEIGGKHGQEPWHNHVFLQKLWWEGHPKGNCTTGAYWSLFLFCKKKKKLPLFDHACKTYWFLFQPFPVYVGNLAQNSTTLSLSNEPLLLIRSCDYNMPSFLLLFRANNVLSIIVKHEAITLRILGYVSPFFQNYAWSYIRIFGNSKFSTKTEIMLMFVQNKWVLEIQVNP